MEAEAAVEVAGRMQQTYKSIMFEFDNRHLQEDRAVAATASLVRVAEGCDFQLRCPDAFFGTMQDSLQYSKSTLETCLDTM